MLHEVPDPERFGVPVLADGKIVKIEEKPETPGSQYAVTGIYMYDHKVFDTIRTLKPSAVASWRSRMSITPTSSKVNYHMIFCKAGGLMQARMHLMQERMNWRRS